MEVIERKEPACAHPGVEEPEGPADRHPPAQRTFQGMMMGQSGMAFTTNGCEFDGSRTDSAPKLGTTEDWTYVNATMMDHPMHVEMKE